MPAEISESARSRIVFYAALGYTQREISDEVGVSRNTVRKYLTRTREVVESSANPEETLAAIVRDDYDWDRPNRTVHGLGDLPM